MRSTLGQQRAAEVARLRDEEGLMFREIGERLGIAVNTAHSYYTDPTGEKAYARKRKRHGTCIDCGAETHNGGSVVVPERCQSCAQGQSRTLSARRQAHERCNKQVKWSDDEILSAIRSIAVDGIANKVAYDAKYATEPRGSMPSLPTIINRYGLWSAAAQAAGLRTTRKMSGLPYSNRMPAEGCLLAVEECAAELGRLPSYAEYEEWAKLTGAPSGALIRIRCGRWMAVIEIIAAQDAEAQAA